MNIIHDGLQARGIKEMSDYFINASELDYNMLPTYICSSLDIEVAYLWVIVPLIVIIVLIANSYTLK